MDLVFNTFALVILIALFLEQTLHFLANMLNLGSLRDEPPRELQDLYDRETYRKSQDYTRANTRFGMVSSTYSLVILLVFWWCGGFNAVDRFAVDFAHGPVVTGLIFFAIFILAKTLLDLPFSIYGTFVLEARFGFNKTTVKTFIMDRLKGLLLTGLLGAPLAAGVLYFFHATGAHAWLYCWGAVTLFSLAVQYIAPTWIMPLFNKFTPLENEELKGRIMAYAQAVNFPVSKVFVIDGSRRSSKGNAFFSGFGRNRRIALFDTLVEKQSVSELVAVLAHEIGHYLKRHILKGMIIGIVHSGVIFFLLSLFLTTPGLHTAFAMERVTIHGGLIFFGLLYAPIEMILSIGMAIISRKHEFEADHHAATTISDPQDMINALKNLSVSNLVNLTPHPFYVFLNYSHPPLLQRIQAIGTVKEGTSNE